MAEASSLPLGTRAAASLRALVVLARELGWWRALACAFELRRRRRSLPFASLAPAADWRERECRRQAGDTLVLHGILGEQLEAEAALELTRRVVVAAGVTLMRAQLPPLHPRQFTGLQAETRRQRLLELVETFPNLQLGAVEIEDESFRFEVSGCRLLELAKLGGQAELASCFCACDDRFFSAHQPELLFERPTTLARGGDCCDFRFRWRDADERKDEGDDA